MLPEPGCPAHVLARRDSLEAFQSPPTFLVPPLGDSAEVGEGRHADAPAVSEPHLVATHQVHAGGRSPGQHDVEREFEITVLPRGEELPGCVRRWTIDEHTSAGHHGEREGTSPIGGCATRNFPIVARRPEAVQVRKRDGRPGKLDGRRRRLRLGGGGEQGGKHECRELGRGPHGFGAEVHWRWLLTGWHRGGSSIRGNESPPIVDLGMSWRQPRAAGMSWQRCWGVVRRVSG